MFNGNYIVVADKAQHAEHIFPNLGIVAVANATERPGTVQDLFLRFVVIAAIHGNI